VPVRHLATVGGNLFARQPYGDLAVALVALGAEAEIVDGAETSRVSVESIVVDPVVTHGVVTAVSFPLPVDGGFRYLKAMRRRYNSGSLATVAATVDESGGVVSAARVALGGVGPRVIRAHAVEAALIGHPLDEASVQAAAAAGLTEISPADDAYASAWYRARVFPVHLRRALLGH
jgi:carbon-monoxide dehydrogenase medium subunit